jgi:hypothetical protein
VKRGIVVLTVVLLVAGCSNAVQPIDPGVSTELQAGVVEVADAAATGDFAAGLTRLDELQAELDAAIDAGGVTAQAAVTIQTAIDAVRADLVTLATPEPGPAPGKEEKPGKGDKPEKPGKDK